MKNSTNLLSPLSLSHGVLHAFSDDKKQRQTNKMSQKIENFLFTSESVNEGHPDKLADQVSDGVLDAILAQDPDAKVACENRDQDEHGHGFR